MKPTHLIFAIACAGAGCSSEPVKAPASAEPQAARVTRAFAAKAPAAASDAAVRPEAQPRLAADPLDDPRSPLSQRTIYYDLDQSVIKDEYRPVIRAHAGYLAAHPHARVRIEGNCDERGSREYNLALGQRRADGVKAALKLLGTADGQVETVSWGEEKPSAAEHDESAWAKNRHSDIFYEKTP
jgi:peptidoglycan-associated lipoprotein